MLIRYPKEIKAGTKLEHLALNIDIAPTLLEWGRAPVPGSMDGKSLLPLFRSKRAKLRDLAFLEYFAEPNYPRQAGWQAVRSDRYKYIHYTELDGMDEFYDLKADPYELNNLINDPGSKKTVEKFRAEQKKFFAKAK